MKKFLATLLILILLGGASLVYFLAKSFNAEAYQQQIIQTISELTGRKFVVSGQTSVRFIPMPTIVMTGVYLTNQSGSDRANMITIDTVKVQIEWSSLLKTPLVVKSIELGKPTLYLERLESNRANWDLPLFSAPDENINDGNLLAGASAIGNTKIDQVDIKSGSIFYINKITKKTMELKNINAELSIDSLKGPYAVKGTAHAGKEILSGSFNVGRIRNDSPATLTAKIEEKNSELSIDFNGKITKNNPTSLFTGDGSFTLKKPAPILTALGLSNPPETLTKSAVGSFTLDGTPLVDTLKNFTIRFGNEDTAFAMTSTLAYAYETKTAPAKISGDIAFNTLDIDAFKPMFKNVTLKSLTTDNPHPIVNLKLDMTRVKIGADTLKNFKSNLSYLGPELRLTDGSVLLPGDTAAEFAANTGQTKGTPYVLVFAKGKTTAVKPLLSFLKIDTLLSGMDKVKSLDADVRVTLAPNFMSVLLNGVQFDATTLSGSIDWETGAKKAFAVTLNVDNLNLDTYTGWKAPQDKIILSDLPELIRQRAAEPNALANADITFKTTFSALTWHNLPMTSGILAGSLKEGTLTLTNAEFSDTATANLKATATLTGIGKPTAALSELSLNFTAEQLPVFMQRAGLTSSLPLFTSASDTQIAGTLSGTNNIWKTNVMANLSDAEIKLAGTISLVGKQTKFQSFNFNVNHPNFQKFLGLMNQAPSLFKNLDGGLRASGTLNGTDNALKLSPLEASVGTQRISGTLDYSADSAGQKIVADLGSPALDLDRVLPSANTLFKNGRPSPDAFNFTPLNEWDVALKLSAGRLTYKTLDLMNAKTTVTLKDKTLSVTNLNGTNRAAGNAPFAADASLTWATEPTLKVSLNASDITVRPDFFIVNKFSYGGGKSSLKGEFLTAGNSPAAMLSSLGGSGNVLFAGGTFIGMDLAKIDPLIKKTMAEGSSQDAFDTALARLLQLGKTPVTSMGGAYTITKGLVRFMDMTVKTPTAIATPTQLTYNAPTGSVELSMPMTLNAYTQFPPILISASADAGKSLYTSDTADLSNAVLGVVKKEAAATEAATSAATAQKEQVAAANRQTAVKQAIIDANKTVKQISADLQNTSTEKAAQLMQNAADALAVVNQLAIKERLTSEQEDKILEYSRLSVLKANEAKAAAAEDNVLDYRQTIAQFNSKASAMVTKMKKIGANKTQIAIIPRLVKQAEQDLMTLANIQSQVADKAGESALLAQATEAYKSIETAYENVVKFESETPPAPTTKTSTSTVTEPAPTPAPAPVRGTIRRPGIRG